MNVVLAALNPGMRSGDRGLMSLLRAALWVGEVALVQL